MVSTWLKRTFRILAGVVLGLSFFTSMSCAVRPSAHTWTLNTEDTRITLGIAEDSRLCLQELRHPAGEHNWAETPATLAFMSQVDMAQAAGQQIHWAFQRAEVDNHQGQKVTLIFTCSQPALELLSIWQARPGHGPIHHQMFITNQTGETVVIYTPQSLALEVACPAPPMRLWYFSDNAFKPDPVGTYIVPMTGGLSKTIISTSGDCWNGGDDFIPYVVLDADSHHGLYMGLEWSNGRTQVSTPAENPVKKVTVRSGLADDFKTDLYAGETFEVPAAFIGTYQGDIDDAGNSLRKYLFQYNTPEVLRTDSSYPKTSWNAIVPTGKTWCAWDTVESKFYPFVDAIAPLGFDEVIIDINWWDAHAPRNSDPNDWPKGMRTASDYVHDRNMDLVLYWNQNTVLTHPEGKAQRIADARYLYEAYNIDVYRTDSTNGPVIRGENGGSNRAHYGTDVTYWATKSFYDVLDTLSAKIPQFKWENCGCGAPILDFGAMKRTVRVQCTDVYASIQTRQAFYDAAHCFPPMQIGGVVIGIANYPDDKIFPEHSDHKLMFRSSSMGASWWAPCGPNGYPDKVVPWTDSEKQELAKAVATYKTRLRPLIRSADLYHIFPRPNGADWDGIEYYDPATRKGVVYIFQPIPQDTTRVVRLKGLDLKRSYRITFEDQTNAEIIMSGAELTRTGITVRLPASATSELMFFEAVPQ